MKRELCRGISHMICLARWVKLTAGAQSGFKAVKHSDQHHRWTLVNCQKKRRLKSFKDIEDIWIFAQSGFKGVKHNDQHPATASLLNAGQLSKKNFASRILLDPNVVQIQFINMLSRFCKCAIALFAADLQNEVQAGER